ncbi:MAG TPA: hypothetical protein VG872_12840 [Acidimicrobiia bacterium]|nr:hypothetical protein [Acidimicrobiia bacterium]
MNRLSRGRLSGRPSLIGAGGVAVLLLSLAGMVVGLVLVGSLAGDYRSVVSVSRSAVDVIGETIASVDDIAAGTSRSLESAGGSVEQAASTLDDAVVTLEQVAVFLEEDLPEQLESIRSAMPAAIQTADAVDATLRALSFFGVDYDPEEPFGDSLARVDDALAGLPEELRAQSEALRSLIPSATDLATETGDLAGEMATLSESLEGFIGLTGRYEETLAEAEASIERTTDAVEPTIWLIRLLVVLAGIGGAVVGLALTAVGGALARLQSSPSMGSTGDSTSPGLVKIESGE